MAIIILFVSLCKNKHRPVTLTSNGTCEKARHRSLSLPPACLIQVGISGKPGQEVWKSTWTHGTPTAWPWGGSLSTNQELPDFTDFPLGLFSHTTDWGFFKMPTTPVCMGRCVDKATHQALVQAPSGPLDLLVCGVGVYWRLIPSSHRQAASVPNICPTSQHGVSALHLAELGWFAAVQVPAGAWHWAAFPRNASHLELPFLALPHLLTSTESY